ncbi:uncharacterized protein LOC120665882 isoform X2 [Panicum virgatum]|uniref:uncharacterized protein LOC120665882 isoform X2 n=1 Tax=Panicum virgatum TaxID=38727 RepID=UPI0019D5C36D|nr:uncharacterized protein LOC120665882 isoform X2 [Panicum virgatum]
MLPYPHAGSPYDKKLYLIDLGLASKWREANVNHVDYDQSLMSLGTPYSQQSCKVVELDFLYPSKGIQQDMLLIMQFKFADIRDHS